MKTLPLRAGEMQVGSLRASPSSPMPNSFANVASATATTSASPAAARVIVNLAVVALDLHSLKERLEDIPFADES